MYERAYINPAKEYPQTSPVKEVTPSALEEAENIHRQISNINDVLEMLTAKLYPALREVSKPEYPVECNVRATQSPLVESLISAKEKLDDITSRLYNLKDSVQL